MSKVFSARIAMLALIAALPACGPALGQTADANPLKLSPHHATLSVADLDGESRWLERVLGFQVLMRDEASPDFKLRQMGIPGYRIDLVWQKGSARHRQAAGGLEQGWLHVVFKSPQIDKDYRWLVSQKTDVKAYKHGQASEDQTGFNRLTFHDPEGNEIEIVTP